jgi:hypothetical protein
MASRCIKRSGFHNLIGALNPKISISSMPPLKPKQYDLWINTQENRKYYFNIIWIQIGV